MKKPVNFFWKKKPKPKKTGQKCKKCGKELMDFELIQGCFYCNQVEKIKLNNE